MKTSQKLAAVLVAAAILSAPSLFADKRHEKTTSYARSERSDARRMTVEGRIRDIDRDRNGYVIRLHDGEVLFAPVQTRVDARGNRRTRVRDLERGDYIRATGRVESRRALSVDHITLLRDEDRRRDRNDALVSGVVESFDRRAGVVWIRDGRSGVRIAVDVRGVPRNDREEILHLRRGDRITARGDWRRDGKFEAERIDSDARRR